MSFGESAIDQKIKTDKKQATSGLTSGESGAGRGIARGWMRYYPAFGVKSKLLAPFRRVLSV
jgi:hypothetical protein